MDEMVVVQLTFQESTGKAINNILDACNLICPVVFIRKQDYRVYKIRFSCYIDMDLFIASYYKNSIRNKIKNIQIFDKEDITGRWDNKAVLRRYQ